MQRGREAAEGAESSSAPLKRQKIEQKRRKMAYLGPPGTYGHQAALQFLTRMGETDVEMIPCPTITDIYYTGAAYLVMPLQNTIQGGVSETLDCLLFPQSPDAGPSKSSALGNGDARLSNGAIESNGIPLKSSPPPIVDDLDLPIRHCLVAKRGTRLEDIKWVRSHEQALGQSSVYLTEHLPHAKRIQWPSTAGSAEYLLTPEAEKSGPGAAICSRSVVDLYPELEILKEGTQSIEDNFTRFLLLSREPLGGKGKSRSRLYALPDPSMLPSVLKEDAAPVRQVLYRPYPPDSGSSDEKYRTALLVELEGTVPLNEQERNGSSEETVHRYLGATRSITE